MTRTGRCERTTQETRVEVDLTLEGTGRAEISSGIGFLDHMLGAIARHARFDLTLTCAGDLAIDDHHSAEDTALALGAALDDALGDRRGIIRFAHAHAPLDEALARVVVDLSGRPHAEVRLALTRDRIGDLACENITHFFRSLAIASRACIHADVIRGDNDHHKAEAACKALALALRGAVALDPGSTDIPSTKGTLS